MIGWMRVGSRDLLEEAPDGVNTCPCLWGVYGDGLPQWDIRLSQGRKKDHQQMS